MVVTSFACWGVAVLGLADPIVTVRGTMTCPTATEVAERLRPLLGEEATSGPASSVEVEVSEAPNSAEVARSMGARSGSGRRVSVRRVATRGRDAIFLGSLPVSTSCDDAANDIAVFIAASLTTYETPPAEDLSLPERAPAAGPASPEARGLASAREPGLGPTDAAEPPGSRASGSATTASSRAAPARSREVSGVRRSMGDPDGPRRRWNVELGLAAGAERGGAASGIAGRAAADATLWLDPAWLARVTVWASATRSFDVASGGASWRRLGLVAAAGREWRLRSVALDATFGAVVAESLVRGSGFPSNDTSTSVDLGASPGIRLGSRLPMRLPVVVWVQVGADVWLRPHELTVAGLPDSRALPWLDGVATLGTTIGFEP